MITNHDPALQTTVAILRSLVEKQTFAHNLKVILKTSALHDTKSTVITQSYNPILVNALRPG